MIAALFLSLALFFVAGVPVAFALGLSGVAALLVYGQVPFDVVPQRAFAALDSWALMAVPLFILAGELMNAGGISRRVIAVAEMLVGRLRARLAIVTVTASMFFAGISGSASADTAAVGSVMIPAMRRAGYDVGFAAALQAAAGAIGPIIPPSIIMIVMGFVTETSISALFLGGVVPGLLIGAALMATSYGYARRHEIGTVTTGSVDASRLPSVWEGLPAIGMPLVVLGGIILGAFTATEAAGVAVVYSLIVGRWLFHELRLADLPRILVDSALRSCVVMFVATSAYLFAWIVAVGRVPDAVGGFLEAWAGTPVSFLLACNLILVVIGTFMESISAIIVIMPILFPLAVGLGIDPVHFGVVASVNLCIGMVTPPYGATLFVACTLSGQSVSDVAPWTVRPVLAMVAVLLLITFVPDSVTALPRLFAFK